MKDKNYFRQLDALRGIAVMLVIVSHWFDASHILNRFSPNGVTGVTLFFVLSGFLITDILLSSKEIVENGNSISKAFKTFYIRRSLRIFPVYYVLIAALYVVDKTGIRETLPWHVFYASNFLFWIKGTFVTPSLSHFWSLAVEEQFYLIWPALILFLPKKRLQLLFAAGIVVAFVFRILIITQTNELGRLLMPGSLDSFCIGALLAYGRRYNTPWYAVLNRQKFLVIGSFVLFALTNILLLKVLATWYFSLYFLLISLIFGFWINMAASGVSRGPLKLLLNFQPLLFIGKISYGVYLFHNFVPFFYGIPFPEVLEPYSFYLNQLIRFCLLIVLASISWFVIENPFNSLKKYFEYNKSNATERSKAEVSVVPSQL